jgi:hypothetical protein
MGKTRLLEAVRKLEVTTARRLLDAQPELLRATDRDKRPLIQIACGACAAQIGVPAARGVALVRLLLDRGFDADGGFDIGEDYDLNNTWIAVARGRNRGVVKLLLDRGARPKGLFAAGWHQDLATLKLLLARGAEVDEQAEDETPFLHCCKNQRWRAAAVLLRAGADVDFQDSKGKSALHYAIEKDFDPARLRWLIRHGADPDRTDKNGVSARRKAQRKRDPGYGRAVRG